MFMYHTSQVTLTNPQAPLPYLRIPRPQPRPPLAIPAFRILTQNVDGFRVDSVRTWMASWKDRLTHERLDIICLQETHVGSPAQVTSHANLWNICGASRPSRPLHSPRPSGPRPPHEPAGCPSQPLLQTQRLYCHP
ncbi:hypothetical protein DYB36_005212 [Aphanomyces astaci]|uniref:Endonuclease/exonuclease/phosphatase domain-containing protein n=1 Tax=Aphanomyces astaci TaxID=112090 RepID=A0A397A7B7_APHAT|nr:hypothetical protein DYB36_005212 [Aphanomyces astaci]